MMWARLSLAYGKPIRQLQAEMTHAEFIEMWGYYLAEGWGTPVADMHAAQIVANVRAAAGERNVRVTDCQRRPLVERRETPQERVRGLASKLRGER